MSTKWRPPLALVLGCTIAAILGLGLGGVVAVELFYGTYGTVVLWLVTAAVLVGSAYVGWVLWRILLRPISALAAKADKISKQDLRGLDPLPHYGTQEMHQLGRRMVGMGRVLQGREMVMRSYADHVTHELTSPLSAIQGAAELLADPDLKPATRKALLDTVDASVTRMRDLIAAQRALAKAADPVAAGQVRLSDAAPEGLRIMADGMVPLPRAVLQMVLEHLVSNAKNHGAKVVEARVDDAGLTIADDGKGVTPGNRARIFDPFFTTRRDAGGTGMGLTIVRRMLEAQGARIDLIEGPGAVFRIGW